MTTWVLDQRLEKSSFYIQDQTLCQIRLKNNRLYPWVILIPRVMGVSEIHDLSVLDQKILIQEISNVSERMKPYFKADKINCGALGNMVSQLHIHVIARKRSDPLWPEGLWQRGLEEEPYSSFSMQEIIENLFS